MNKEPAESIRKVTLSEIRNLERWLENAYERAEHRNDSLLVSTIFEVENELERLKKEIKLYD